MSESWEEALYDQDGNLIGHVTAHGIHYLSSCPMNEPTPVEKVLKIIKDVQDEPTCTDCGGKCCLLYLRSHDGGTMPNDVGFEDWVCDWDEMFEESGASAITPMFDPLEVHMTGNEHVWDELCRQGINPKACKYMGKMGCSLPRDVRPKTCREYACQRLQIALKDSTTHSSVARF